MSAQAMLAKRPLTTLLLVATVCVDLLAFGLSSSNALPGPTVLLSALYFSQFGLISVWLVIGGTDWRVRLGVWIAGTLITQLFVTVPDERAAAFAVACVYGALVAMLTVVIRKRIASPGATGRLDGTVSNWQFSMIQALVWMTIVAVVATAVRFSDLPEFFNAGIAFEVIGTAIIPVAGLLLLFGRHRARIGFALLLSISGLIGIGLALLFAKEYTRESSVIAYCVIQGLVVGIWMIVVSHETFPAPYREKS